jgi:hypothetical protein
VSAAVLRSLANNLKQYLEAQPEVKVKFSAAGLKPFFDKHPEHRAIVQAYPGLLGGVVARARSLEVQWAAGGAEIRLSPPRPAAAHQRLASTKTHNSKQAAAARYLASKRADASSG